MSAVKDEGRGRRAGAACAKAAAQPGALVFALVFALAAALALPAGREIYGYWREDVFLASLLESAGVAAESVSVTGWVRVAEWAAGGDLERLAGEVAAGLGLAGEGQKSTWQNLYARGVALDGRTAGGHLLCVKAQALVFPGGGETAHLLVEVSGLKMWEAPLCQRALRGALSRYGGGCSVAVECAGWLRGAPDGIALEEGARRLMEEAGAVVTERTVRDNLAALAGRTERLTGTKGSTGRTANLGVTLHSDPQRGATRLTVSAPVVFKDY